MSDASPVGEGTDDAVGDYGVLDTVGEDVTGVQPFVPNSAEQCADELQACYDQEECYGCIYLCVRDRSWGVGRVLVELRFRPKHLVHPAQWKRLLHGLCFGQWLLGKYALHALEPVCSQRDVNRGRARRMW